MGLKYFDKIYAAQKEDGKRPAGPLDKFDFESLATRSKLKRWATRFALDHALPVVTAVLRGLCPNPRFGRVIIVTRREDAVAVLKNMSTYKVVYQPEMFELGGGADNVLSLDGLQHDTIRAALEENLKEDIGRVAEWSTEYSRALLKAAGGRIDVMRDLVTRTATEVVCRLIGITANDPDAFAEWTMAVSMLLFGDYFGDPKIRKQAQIGSAFLRAQINDAIRRVRLNDAKHPNSARPRVTLIDRLITNSSMSDAQICATVIGLITAFIPTNTLAAGNILQVLRSRSGMMKEARAAAAKGDRQALQAILLEAGRLSPALSPGLWRHLPADGAYSTIAPGTWRTRKVRPGSLLLVCIPSALRDGRIDQEPGENSRERAWLMFGAGSHDCLGAGLALAHLTSVFSTLLTLPRLRAASDSHGARMVRVGPYPTRLDMVWDDSVSKRAFVLAAIPVLDGTSPDDLEHELETIGNPVNRELAARLDATERILFTSLTVIEKAPNAKASIMLVELSGDGTQAEAITALATAAFADYSSAFRHCTPDGKAPVDAEALSRLISNHAFDLHRWPWATTGLHFDGLPGLSVADIDRQAKLAEYARKSVRFYLNSNLQSGARAMDVLTQTRRMIRQDSFYALLGRGGRKGWGALFAEGRQFHFDLVRPSRKRSPIADWVAPKSMLSPVWKLITSRSGIFIPILLALLWAGLGFALGAWLIHISGGAAQRWIWTVIVAVVGGAALAATVVAASIAAALLRLRWLERRDSSDDRLADLDHVQRIAEKEDAPGFEQNHIVAVMPFKPGLFRRLTFSFSMWWIKQAVTFWFRPGFVVTMGTIHAARWFRVPHTDQFVFFSNYDGSWESYLEDFVTRANEGQSSAWSHGMGFPPTRFLVFEGAADGDRFKRWVRRQQLVTPVWYSRFPTLSAAQIRRNATIEDGLARAANDTDARRWLANFGSAQREVGELETQEAQSILFSGFGHQKLATALLVRLPTSTRPLARWLGALVGKQVKPIHKTLFADAPAADGDDEDESRALPAEVRIRFGDHPIKNGGVVLGLTASGLRKVGLTEGVGLDQFPAAFRMGMAGRTRVLGDRRSADWRFADSETGANCVDAIVIVYGQSEDEPSGEAHRALVQAHRSLVEAHDGTVVCEVPCSPVVDSKGRERPMIEHFGFRDGISQPVIRGTRRTARAAANDLVEPGEFLLGYANNQGFVAPSLGIGAEHDPSDRLPVRSAFESNRYPFFGNRLSNPELRDFGRNGSFLVVRQLDQDTAGFKAQLTAKAAELNRAYRDRLPELIGGPVTAKWLGAKIIGRWQDGSPLVCHPTAPAGLTARDRPGNDFVYGLDDPQGLACPLGAHIRRTNPRDSLEPGDPAEQQITNRHRLLRRGRTYSYRPPGETKRKGLLFMALCSDIERQFEFVQHTWSNAKSFHGLTNEPDPLLGNPLASNGQLNELENSSEPRVKATHTSVFTIPTDSGPVVVEGMASFVQLRGGGYFFVPSRSALLFLIERLYV